VVRPVGPNEASLLAEIGARSFYDAFIDKTRSEDMADYLAKNFAVDKCQAELAREHSYFFFGVLDGCPVGYFHLVAGERPDCISSVTAVELKRIYLLQKFIGQGFGAALINTAVEVARQNGFSGMWLSVWEENPRAIEFYRKWGFCEVGKAGFLVGNDLQQDLLFYRLLL
jgi:diamine N-acetyltransferase